MPGKLIMEVIAAIVFLLQGFSLTSGETIIHVIPSGDQLCPDKPCVDLSQFNLLLIPVSSYTCTSTYSNNSDFSTRELYVKNKFGDQRY